MALQSSGAITISDIKTELNSTSNSLRALSAAAGFSTPDAMSEFYGYSNYSPRNYFDTRSATGNGSTLSISGLNFAPETFMGINATYEGLAFHQKGYGNWGRGGYKSYANEPSTFTSSGVNYGYQTGPPQNQSSIAQYLAFWGGTSNFSASSRGGYANVANVNYWVNADLGFGFAQWFGDNTSKEGARLFTFLNQKPEFVFFDGRFPVYNQYRTSSGSTSYSTDNAGFQWDERQYGGATSYFVRNSLRDVSSIGGYDYFNIYDDPDNYWGYIGRGTSDNNWAFYAHAATDFSEVGWDYAGSTYTTKTITLGYRPKMVIIIPIATNDGSTSIMKAICHIDGMPDNKSAMFGYGAGFYSTPFYDALPIKLTSTGFEFKNWQYHMYISGGGAFVTSFFWYVIK